MTSILQRKSTALALVAILATVLAAIVAGYVGADGRAAAPRAAEAVAPVVPASEASPTVRATPATPSATKSPTGNEAGRRSATKVREAMLSSVMKERSVSRATAVQRLAWQDKAAPLDSELKTALGARAGGVWIGKDDDRLKVGVVGSADGVATVVKRLGLVGAVDVVKVRWSLADLDRAYYWIAGRLDAANAGAIGQLEIALAVDRNAVQLQIPPGTRLTPAQAALVREASTTFGSAVARVAGSKPLQNVACGPANCDLPLRGGTRIYMLKGAKIVQGCTSGFMVRSRSDGANFLLTAGHCAKSPGMYVQAKNGRNGWVNVGPVHRSIYGRDGDVAMIRTVSPVAPVVRTTVNLAHPIRNLGRSVQNMRICSFGATSVVRCGKVIALRQTQLRIQDLTRVGNLTVANYCTEGGDSGGPVVSGHSGVGLVSAGTGGCRFNLPVNNKMFYMELAPALNLMRVNLVTRR